MGGKDTNMYVEELKNGKYRCVQSYKDHLTGKYKKVKLTIEKNTAATRREAEMILMEKIEALATYKVKKEYTFKDIIEKHRAYQKTAVKPTTYHRNYHAGNTLLKLFGEDTLANNINAAFIRDRLTASGRAGSTLNEFMIRIKSIFRWAYQEDLIDDIRFLDKIRPFPDKARRLKISDKFLESNELKELLDCLDVQHNKQFILFMALSGLRPGEVIALTNGDIDTEERVIHVNKTFDPLNKIISTTKTETSERDVYMQDELLQFIKDKLSYNKQLQLSTGIRTNLFFFDLEGNYLKYYAVNKYFKEHCLKKLGRSLTLHSLRHTHASLMFEKGMSLEAISDRLGHASSAITKDVYLHTTNKLKEKFNREIKNIQIF